MNIDDIDQRDLLTLGSSSNSSSTSGSIPLPLPLCIPTKTPAKRPTKVPTTTPPMSPAKSPTKVPTKALLDPTKSPNKAPSLLLLLPTLVNPPVSIHTPVMAPIIAQLKTSTGKDMSTCHACSPCLSTCLRHRDRAMTGRWAIRSARAATYPVEHDARFF